MQKLTEKQHLQMVNWQVYEAGQRGKPEIGRIENKNSKTDFLGGCRKIWERKKSPDVRLSHLIQASPSSHHDPKWMKSVPWKIAKGTGWGGVERARGLYSDPPDSLHPHCTSFPLSIRKSKYLFSHLIQAATLLTRFLHIFTSFSHSSCPQSFPEKNQVKN